MLCKVANNRHSHIISCISAWRQGRRGYILLDLAQYNLRDLLRNQPQPKATREFCVWLLKQIGGLADAVDLIHNQSTTVNGATTLQPTAPMQGYHHDLKPENMLVCYTQRPKDVVAYDAQQPYITGDIKIADFGAGKMNKTREEAPDRSHQSERGNRTPTYESPDSFYGNGFGRAADMWAFGCVILELLQWVFTKQPEKGEKSMRSQLAAPVNSDQTIVFDRFWEIRDVDGTRVPVLKEIVKKWIGLLKKACRMEFSDVLELAQKLLEPSKAMRMTSKDLAPQLKDILASAERRLNDNPDCFANNIESSPRNMLVIPGLPPGATISSTGMVKETERKEELANKEISFIVPSLPKSRNNQKK